MKKSLIWIALLASAGVAAADMLNETALRLYPNSREAQKRYIQNERKSQSEFENYPASASTPVALLKELRAHCIKQKPNSMSGRLSCLQRQIRDHYNLNEAPWGDDLPKDARAKITAVGKMLWAGDYSAQYRYAIAEAQAYRRLQKIEFDKSAAEKKYPNSYQSQLYEVMGVRF